MAQLHLVPWPKSLSEAPGSFVLSHEMYILLSPDKATRDLFAAERFEIEAESLTDAQFRIAVGALSVAPEKEIRVSFDSAVAGGHDQGYSLSIRPAGIEIRSSSPAGTFYAFQTLTQILREAVFTTKQSKIENRKSKIPPIKLPCLQIEDWPDYPRRGIYHDTARGKVPTVDTLLQLIDDLGHLKINEFQLYIENNFEFRKHPQMYDDTTPFTAEELLLLDAACKARHIDFVPSLTSLGHFEKILSRPAFRHLAEAEPEQLKAIGAPCWVDLPWSLCVTDPGSKALLKDMYEEFVPNFSSKLFNICCDESYDLGKVRSKELADTVGVGQLYVDWVNYCNELSKTQGKSIQMWGDIILHHPDLIAQLPEDAILLEWGYEAEHKFDEHCQTIAQRLNRSLSPQSSPLSTRKFYVCPGTSSWNTLASRSKNAFGSIHNAATAGLKHGAAGLLNTDWGDAGHQQMLAVSLNAFAYGAAASWNLAATPAPQSIDNRKSAIGNLLHAISLHLFQDPTGTFATLAYNLGLSYERFGWQRFNAALEWLLFREKWDLANYVNRASPKGLAAVAAACEKLKPQFEEAFLLHPEAEQIAAELIFTCEEIIHTCQRTLLRQQWLAADPAKRNPEDENLRAKPAKPLPRDFKPRLRSQAREAAKLEKQFKKLWLSRNKPSRLEDILKEFHRLKTEYKQYAAV